MKKVAKCPRCCPDGGAIFRRAYDNEIRAVWKCSNCHFEKPIGKKKLATGKRVIAQLERLGWKITKQEHTGRGRLWVEAEHPTRQWFLGNKTWGWVAPNGRFELAWSGLGTTNRKVTNFIGLNVYLGS